MKIVADENIPYVREAFAGLGGVFTLPGRAICRDAVADADMLLVRSITKVDGDLLGGSPVRFVATATIGEDHIDKDWLAAHGIGFASAPGCNAGSVMQYVTAALLAISERLHIGLQGMKLGVVGVGNVGSRVAKAARALGMEIVLNDPPLRRKIAVFKMREPNGAETVYEFSDIEKIFECDAVTLHVPLTQAGADRTHHLVDGAFLHRLRRGAILINTSRGPVVDGVDLAQAIDSDMLRACVLDVWESEPCIDVPLLDRVFIGTPHIAGYSFDGKVNGTRMICEAACRHLGREPDWDPAPLVPKPPQPRLSVDSADAGALGATVRAVYDIMADDARMRRIKTVESAERAIMFDRLRKEYPHRREFFNYTAAVNPADAELETRLAALGFTIEV